MSQVPFIAAAIIVGGAVVSLSLCLLFLLVVYLASGRDKDHLEVAAKALHQIRDVGVASAVRAALERRSDRDAGTS